MIIKAETIEALLLSLIAVFAPIKAVILTILALIVIDAILGVLAARKRGDLITSSGLRRTLSKIILYELAVAACFLAETYLIGTFIPVTKIVSAIVGVIELKSILENADELNGQPVFKSLIDKLGSKNEEK